MARQGTELSSGLRACARQAGDRSSSKEQEESKGEKLKEKKIKLCQKERPKQWYREARQERRFELHSVVTKACSFRSQHLLHSSTSQCSLGRAGHSFPSLVSEIQASLKQISRK